MTYEINHTSIATTPISVQDHTKDASKPINFFGRGLEEYGKEMNESLLSILERFSCDESTTEPGKPANYVDSRLDNPVYGQFWFNRSRAVLCYYDGEKWLELGDINMISANFGQITNGQRLPRPVSRGGRLFDYNECIWSVSPSSIVGVTDYINCSTDSQANVTVEYRLAGETELTSGVANYLIVGIRGNINLGNYIEPTDPIDPSASCSVTASNVVSGGTITLNVTAPPNMSYDLFFSPSIPLAPSTIYIGATGNGTVSFVAPTVTVDTQYTVTVGTPCPTSTNAQFLVLAASASCSVVAPSSTVVGGGNTTITFSASKAGVYPISISPSVSGFATSVSIPVAGASVNLAAILPNLTTVYTVTMSGACSPIATDTITVSASSSPSCAIAFNSSSYASGSTASFNLTSNVTGVINVAFSPYATPKTITISSVGTTTHAVTLPSNTTGSNISFTATATYSGGSAPCSSASTIILPANNCSVTLSENTVNEGDSFVITVTGVSGQVFTLESLPPIAGVSGTVTIPSAGFINLPAVTAPSVTSNTNYIIGISGPCSDSVVLAVLNSDTPTTCSAGFILNSDACSSSPSLLTSVYAGTQVKLRLYSNKAGTYPYTFTNGSASGSGSIVIASDNSYGCSSPITATGVISASISGGCGLSGITLSFTPALQISSTLSSLSASCSVSPTSFNGVGLNCSSAASAACSINGTCAASSTSQTTLNITGGVPPYTVYSNMNNASSIPSGECVFIGGVSRFINSTATQQALTSSPIYGTSLTAVGINTSCNNTQMGLTGNITFTVVDANSTVASTVIPYTINRDINYAPLTAYFSVPAVRCVLNSSPPGNFAVNGSIVVTGGSGNYSYVYTLTNLEGVTAPNVSIIGSDNYTVYVHGVFENGVRAGIVNVVITDNVTGNSITLNGNCIEDDGIGTGTHPTCLSSNGGYFLLRYGSSCTLS